VLDAARQSIRNGFRDKASLPASDPTVQPAIQHAEEVASFLKANLVQGKREGNTYSQCLHPGMDTMLFYVILTSIYPELRIHEHTERGDNDSIKLGNQSIKVDGVKCCSER
jgi:complex III assembly factor LYRM7